jgi:hypothetical protein
LANHYGWATKNNHFLVVTLLHGIANMGNVEQVFVFFHNSWVQVFENKKFKELSSPLLLLLEDLKTHSSSGLRNSKRESCDMRQGLGYVINQVKRSVV